MIREQKITLGEVRSSGVRGPVGGTGATRTLRMSVISRCYGVYSLINQIILERTCSRSAFARERR
jgi:hypothetical protein